MIKVQHSHLGSRCNLSA